MPYSSKSQLSFTAFSLMLGVVTVQALSGWLVTAIIAYALPQMIQRFCQSQIAYAQLVMGLATLIGALLAGTLMCFNHSWQAPNYLGYGNVGYFATIASVVIVAYAIGLAKVALSHTASIK